MKASTYNIIRNLYYSGIFILILYALPAVNFLVDNVYPILNKELFPKFPLVSIIALGTGVGAFMAFKFRKIG